jgi:hypothetical protein
MATETAEGRTAERTSKNSACSQAGGWRVQRKRMGPIKEIGGTSDFHV